MIIWNLIEDKGNIMSKNPIAIIAIIGIVVVALIVGGIFAACSCRDPFQLVECQDGALLFTAQRCLIDVVP